MSTEKSWHTLFDVKFVSRETYATEFAAFEQHKTALLDILRKAYESGPKSEPFDEQLAWSDLIGAAIWLFGRKFDRKPLLPARCRERLLDFANVLKRAGKMADNAMQDDVGIDLFRGWWLEIKGGDLSRQAVDAVANEITDAVAKLAALEAAARRGAKAVIGRTGPPEGTTGLLRMHDILELRGLYQRSTGRQPKGRPFVKFVEEFLVAAGQSGATKHDYVAEALKYAEKKERKEFLRAQRQTTAFR
jgi:hypothetical protein